MENWVSEAVIVDASVLVAAANSRDPDSLRCKQLLRSTSGPLVVPATALAEATFLLQKRFGATAEILLVESLLLDPWIVEGPTALDLVRIVAIMQKYADLPLGYSDAATVALAERLNESRIASLDSHFRIVKPSHVEAFEVLP